MIRSLISILPVVGALAAGAWAAYQLRLRQIRSRTATNPKTHHHFSVFFYDCALSHPAF